MLSVVPTIEVRRAIATARRIRQRMSAVLFEALLATSVRPIRWRSCRGVIVPLIKGRLIKGRQPAFVDFDEEREVFRRAEPVPAHPVIKLASCLLALTALRPGEIRRAAWHEFVCLNGSEPLWGIPGRVPLVDCAHPTALSCCASTLENSRAADEPMPVTPVSS